MKAVGWVAKGEQLDVTEIETAAEKKKKQEKQDDEEEKWGVIELNFKSRVKWRGLKSKMPNGE